MNRHVVMIALLLVVGVTGWWTNAARGDLVIAENGQARATIVVADDAIAPEKHAASELASFLKQVSGGTFAVADKAGQDKPRLLIGPGAATLADASFTTDGLGHDGIVIRTAGNDLILAGGRPRGTLYAVYTFLEDHVGCRWWSSKVSTIPKRPTLKVGDLNVRYVPILEYREPFWFDAFDGDFAVRNKCNGHREQLDAKRGGKHIYQGFVHTFFSLIPPNKYFKDHPEWFSEIDGKRQVGRTQLCLTNEAMRQELVKNLKARLRKNKAATIASVSQNDWHGYCQCAQCKALDAKEGGPAGSLLHFVNKVADDIKDEFPHVAISTLAYQYTRQPPKHVKPRPNVIVRLCSIECSFANPLDSEVNSKFRDDIVGWSKICDRLYIWDYTTNFRHYLAPHPNLRVLGPNVKFFVDHGVKGLFEQGAYQSYGSEMAELRAWVLAKLLWNPSLDAAKLIDEFIDGYWGEVAGKYVRRYLKLTHDEVQRTGDKLGCFSPISAQFLNVPMLSKGLKLLEQAEAAAETETLKHRVRVAQLPILYTFLMRWDVFKQRAEQEGLAWPVSDEIKPVFDRFMGIAKAANVSRVAESGTKTLDWMKHVLNRPKRTKAGPPPGCEDLPGARWVDLQDTMFRLSKEGEWAERVEDAKASDNVAVRMPGTHYEWATSCPLNAKLVKESGGKPIRCKVAIRCEKTGDTGKAFSYGIYDPEHRRGVHHMIIQAKAVKDDDYHVYDLGAHKLTDRMYVWVAPPKNPDNVKAVYVDRIWLIVE